MQSDLLFAIHNLHSYPKRFSSDVSVCRDTLLPANQTETLRRRGALAFLFFVLFTLCPLPPLSNQSRKSLAINHFPPNLLSVLSHLPVCLPLRLPVTFPFQSLLHNSPDSSVWSTVLLWFLLAPGMHGSPRIVLQKIPQFSLCHRVVPILSLRPMQRYLSEPPDLWPVTCACPRLGHTLQDWKPLLHTCISPQPLRHPSFLNSYTSFSVHLNESTRKPSLMWLKATNAFLILVSQNICFYMYFMTMIIICLY